MKNNEFATKNDFLFFQNEILGDIKNIDFKMNENILFKKWTNLY